MRYGWRSASPVGLRGGASGLAFLLQAPETLPAMSQARAPSRVKRYAAFLRGVSPMNAKMPELKKAFEVAGFADVRTVLSSGNVVFSAPAASESAIERKAEAAMQKCLGSAFPTIVRSIDALRR